MQSPTWAELVNELTPRGFVLVLHFELACAACGDWRSAGLMDSQFRPTCPRCGEVSEVSILGRGLTRESVVPWRLVSPALPQALKADERPAAAMQRGERVVSRKRCERFFARARRELAGVG
jgi:hypothetical protein